MKKLQYWTIAFLIMTLSSNLAFGMGRGRFQQREIDEPINAVKIPNRFIDIDGGGDGFDSNKQSQDYKLYLRIKDLKEEEQDFFKAAFKDDVKKINELLKKGVNINVKDNIKQSALSAGIESNSLRAIQFLVNQGIDVNAKNKSGFTPIYDIVKMIRNKYQNKESNLNVLKILLAQNALYGIGPDDFDDTIKSDDTILSKVSKDSAMKPIFDEIIDYKKSVEKDKEDALVNAITHNGKNDSQFTKEQWLRLALLRKDNKQLLYAFDKKFDKKDILTLIVTVPSMPLDFISTLMYEGKITFDDLKPYYDIAKKEDNKKFGKYYLDLQSNIKIHKIKNLSKNELEKIGSFLQND